jgi:cytochrome bd-I ubiquinol oxidase subunit X
MWYFAWMLGFPLAAAFAVLNAMWYELIDDAAKKHVTLSEGNYADAPGKDKA